MNEKIRRVLWIWLTVVFTRARALSRDVRLCLDEMLQQLNYTHGQNHRASCLVLLKSAFVWLLSHGCDDARAKVYKLIVSQRMKRNTNNSNKFIDSALCRDIISQSGIQRNSVYRGWLYNCYVCVCLQYVLCSFSSFSHQSKINKHKNPVPNAEESLNGVVWHKTNKGVGSKPFKKTAHRQRLLLAEIDEWVDFCALLRVSVAGDGVARYHRAATLHQPLLGRMNGVSIDFICWCSTWIDYTIKSKFRFDIYAVVVSRPILDVFRGLLNVTLDLEHICTSYTHTHTHTMTITPTIFLLCFIRSFTLFNSDWLLSSGILCPFCVVLMANVVIPFLILEARPIATDFVAILFDMVINQHFTIIYVLDHFMLLIVCLWIVIVVAADYFILEKYQHILAYLYYEPCSACCGYFNFTYSLYIDIEIDMKPHETIEWLYSLHDICNETQILKHLRAEQRSLVRWICIDTE